MSVDIKNKNYLKIATDALGLYSTVEKAMVDCKPTAVTEDVKEADICEIAVEDGLEMVADILEMVKNRKVEPRELLSYIAEEYEDVVASASACTNYEDVYDGTVDEIVTFVAVPD